MAPTRRAYLAGAGAAALAGCLDAVPGVGSSTVPEGTDWLPVDLLTRDDVWGVWLTDLEAVVDWEGLEQRPGEAVATSLGLDIADFQTALTVDGVERQHVLLGSVDGTAVRETVTVDGEYGGFEVGTTAARHVAFADDALVLGDDVELLVDAHRGDRERIVDAIPEWERVLASLGTDPVVFGGDHDDESIVVNGYSVDRDETFRYRGEIHFESVDAAEAGLDDIIADIERDATVGAEDIVLEEAVVSFTWTDEEYVF